MHVKDVTELGLACRSCDAEEISRLLASGADPNATFGLDDMTPLQFLVAAGPKAAAARLSPLRRSVGGDVGDGMMRGSAPVAACARLPTGFPSPPHRTTPCQRASLGFLDSARTSSA